jgi:hypothetical protein
MVWEAQWPNRTPGALFEPPEAVAGQGTGVTSTADGGSISILVDPAIPDADWAGARVFLIPGYEWQSDSRPVSGYDPTTHTLTLDTSVPWASTYTQPIPTNRYFLYGSPVALDTQDEWTLVGAGDASAASYTLLYDSSDDPANHGLEYKKRPYAFDVAQSYVQVVGFRVVGAAVRLVGNGNTVDSLTSIYPTHLREFDAFASVGDVNRVVGNDNIWKNSLIEKSGTAGLIVDGNDNLIENNIADDVDYQATNHAAFDMDGQQGAFLGNVFAYNTVNRAGRSGIVQIGSMGGRVVLNEIAQWALLTTDIGGIYSVATDGAGTEIAYNELGGSNAFWSNGIYFDDGAKHFVVHHNYVHDSTYFAFNFRAENDFFNNTVERVGAPFTVDKNYTTGQWDAANLSKVENDLTDGAILVRVGLLPAVVTDGGSFEAPVAVTPDWQHVTVPFSSMQQPPWVVQEPFDLAAVAQITFVPATNGDFEIDLDNLVLEGAAWLSLDDFEANATNAIGGSPWAGGSGDGTTGTFVELSLAPGGPPGSTRYAAITGTSVLGYGSWGLFLEPTLDRDLSAFTALSFDVRGSMRGFRVLALHGNPVQDHNANCAASGTDVPSCAVGQGAILPGIAESPSSGAPDIGAFQSAVAPWVPGARRPDDDSLCGKLADVDASLPSQAPNPWAQSADSDASPGPDGAFSGDAASDASPGPDGALGGDAPATAGSAKNNSSGCACRTAKPQSAGDLGLRAAGLWLLFCAALTSRRRRRSRCPRDHRSFE